LDRVDSLEAEVLRLQRCYMVQEIAVPRALLPLLL
jgi:hypothetical protein